MKPDGMSGLSIFRVAGGILALSAVLLQFGVRLAQPTGPDALTRTINYFSYFTILSNVLAASALILPEIARQSTLGRFFARYGVRTGIAVYMIVTASIYALFLAGPFAPTLQYFTDVILHYVMPPLYLLDWVMMRPPARPRWDSIPSFFIFPIAYGAYTFARGAIVGTYPYFFLDVGKLGTRAVLINWLGLILFGLVLSVLLIAMAQLRGPSKTLSRSG